MFMKPKKLQPLSHIPPAIPLYQLGLCIMSFFQDQGKITCCSL